MKYKYILILKPIIDIVIYTKLFVLAKYKYFSYPNNVYYNVPDTLVTEKSAMTKGLCVFETVSKFCANYDAWNMVIVKKTKSHFLINWWMIKYVMR